MKYFYLTLFGLIICSVASAQILKTEKDPKTGQEIKAAVVILSSGVANQLNFFSRGNEKLIEFVEGRSLEGYPERILKTLAINIKLKNDSVYHFPIDISKYTALEANGFLHLSTVAVVQDSQLQSLLNSPVIWVNLDIVDRKGSHPPIISDNNRREIKKAIAYVLGDKK